MNINNIKQLQQNIYNLKSNDLLYYSSDLNYFNGIKLAIKNGADINLCNDLPLRNACYFNDIKLIKYLIENNANINACDNIVLLTALLMKNKPLIIYLIEKNSNVNELFNHSIKFGKILQHLIKNDIDILELLIQHNLNINMVKDYYKIDLNQIIRKIKLKNILV